MNLKNGTRLQAGRYTIVEVLGQGGFGITYLAEQTGLGRKVAVKEFYMEGHCDRDAETSSVVVGTANSKELVARFRKKFIKEARSIASLRHSNIVPIIDIFEENDTAYYVMAYLDGGSLNDLVKGHGALDERDVLKYVKQVASALDYIHDRKMMHLDVKPSNILLDDDGNAVLIDFGLSKEYDSNGLPMSTVLAALSHGYSPLEQYREGGVDQFSPATDIYSLGATMYKLLTGNTPPEAVELINSDLPPMPKSISPLLVKAVEKAMSSRRKDRPQSIKEFLAILAAFASSETSSAAQKNAVATFADKTEIVSASAKTEIASADRTEIAASPVSAKTEIVSASDKTEIASSDRTEIAASPASAKTEIVSASDKTEIVAAADKTEIAARVASPVKVKVNNVESDEATVLPVASAVPADNEETVIPGTVRKPVAPVAEPNKKGNGKLIAVIVILVVLLVAALLAVILMIGGDKEPVREDAVATEQSAGENVALSETDVVAEHEEEAHRPAVSEPETAVNDVPDTAQTDEVPAPAPTPAPAPVPAKVEQTVQEPQITKEPSSQSGSSKVNDSQREANLRKGISAAKMVDLGLPSGTKWAGYNVGATSPEQYGSYYSWGELYAKEIFSEGNHVSVSYKDISGTGNDVARKQWGGSWRMPTREEARELAYRCKWEKVEYNGVAGFRVIGPNGNSIFVPASGHYEDDVRFEAGVCAYFWIATAYSGGDGDVYYFCIENDMNVYYGSSWVGMPVRAVCK